MYLYSSGTVTLSHFRAISERFITLYPNIRFMKVIT